MQAPQSVAKPQPSHAPTGAVGKHALLVFATTWCDVCRHELPHLTRWAERNATWAETSLVISGSEPEAIRRLISDRKIREDLLRIVDDHDGHLANAFAVMTTPTLVLVDGTGAEIARFHRIDDVPNNAIAAAHAVHAAPAQ